MRSGVEDGCPRNDEGGRWSGGRRLVVIGLLLLLAGAIAWILIGRGGKDPERLLTHGEGSRVETSSEARRAEELVDRGPGDRGVEESRADEAFDDEAPITSDRLVIRIEDPRGVPQAGVRVETVREDGHVRCGGTDSRGEFGLRYARPLDVVVKPSGRPAIQRRAEAPGLLRVVLEDEEGMACRLLIDDRAPGVPILLGIEDGSNASVDAIRLRLRSNLEVAQTSVETDVDGRFVLRGYREGTELTLLTPVGLRVSQRFEYRTGRGEIHVFDAGSSPSLCGRVIDLRGKPIEGASVELVGELEDGTRRPAGDGRTGSTGRFWFSFWPREAIDHWELTLTHGGYREAIAVEKPEHGFRNLGDIVVPDGDLVRLKLVDDEGRSLRGGVAGFRGEASTVVAGDDGRMTLGPFVNHRPPIVVGAQERRMRELANYDVGEEIEVRLDAAPVVRVTVTRQGRPVAGLPVSIVASLDPAGEFDVNRDFSPIRWEAHGLLGGSIRQHDQSFSFRAVTDSEGVVRFTDVPRTDDLVFRTGSVAGADSQDYRYGAHDGGDLELAFPLEDRPPLRIRAMLADGRPAAHVVCEMVADGVLRTRLRCDEKGRLDLPGAGGIPLRIRASRDDLPTIELEGVVGSEEPDGIVSLVFSPLRRAEIRVLRPDGTPAVDFRVFGPRARELRVLPLAPGAFEVRDPPRGEIKIVALGGLVTKEVMHDFADDAPLTIDLPEHGQLRVLGEATEGMEPAWMTVWKDGALVGTAGLAAGRPSEIPIPVGTYRIRVHDRRKEPKPRIEDATEVAIVAGATIAFP